MDQIRHDALMKRLDRRPNLRMVLLVIGVMLWYGFAIGPALVAAWAVELTISTIVGVATKPRSR